MIYPEALFLYSLVQKLGFQAHVKMLGNGSYVTILLHPSDSEQDFFLWDKTDLDYCLSQLTTVKRQ